jgi:hypothetical protein
VIVYIIMVDTTGKHCGIKGIFQLARNGQMSGIEISSVNQINGEQLNLDKRMQ